MKRPSITTAADESGATRARAAGFVGRVGVLAVALGIGAVLGGPVVATADTGNTGTEDASADSPAQPPRGRAAGSGRTSTAPAGDTGTGSRRPAGSTTERGSRSSTAGDPAVPAAVPHNDTIGPAAAKVAVRPVIVQPPQADSSPSSSSPSSSSPSPSSAALRAPVGIPAPIAPPRAAATIPVVTASALRSVVATVTAPVAAATPAPAATVAPVIGVLGAILAPLSGTGTGAPAESPASWLVAAATRRLGRPVARRPLAAQVTVAPAAAVAGAATATATATGTTTTITWAWGTNPVLPFNPATDKLDFGWMQPSAFTVAETAGSTQIAIVDNNHAYTLKNVPLSQLTMANIVAQDTGTVAKWQTLITNAQSVVTPKVSVANATVAEGNSGTTGAAFTVALSKASTKTVTVGYSTANGTATAGTDYTAKTGTLTFAPGVTTQTVTVAVTGDATVEPTEAFTVTLANPVGATLGTATATGTITNDDVAVTAPTVSVANATVSEGNSGTTNAAFAVTLSKAATTTVTVGYSTANGTATAGTDYTAKTGTLTFAPGVTTQTVTVAVTGDATVEPTEAFTVTLANPVGATLGTATATGTITNDDTAVTPVTGTGTIYNVTTAGPDITGFNPAKDKLDLGDVSVHNFIVVDTPDGVGFRSPWTGETAVIQGVSLGQLTVDNFTPIINDHLRQDLSGALAWEHGITAAPNTVYVRSHEVGQVDTVAFNPATDVVDFRYYGTREQIYLSDSPDGVIIGNAGTGQALVLKGVTKSQLTATNFVFHSAQVREDSLYKQLGFASMPDTQIKPQGVPVAGTTVWPTAAGNGTPPAGQTGTTTVIAWKNGTDTPLAFDPSKDKLDFGWFKATEFDVTDTSGSTKITIVGNNQTYTLTGVTLGQLQTGNIIALDSGARTKWQNLIFAAVPTTPLPSLSVADRSAAEGNTGTSNMDFTVLLSQAATKSVSVGYATSSGTAVADDFAATAGTLTFAPGETSKIVRVAVNGDTMYELNDQFTLNLSNPVNATIADAAATGTLVNDDIDPSPTTPPKVSIADLAVTEGNGEHAHFMFTATLDKASATPVSVRYATSNGTGTAGVDYTADAGTITFAAGVTTQTVHVGIIGDTIVEPNETFTVTLSAPSGVTVARGTAIGTIVNDDAAAVVTPPTVSVADASVIEGNSGTSNLAFTVSLSKSSASAVTVLYATSNGTATAGKDFTAGSGTITFSPGVISQTVNVVVTGDATVEPSETFTVTLSSPSGATLSRATATGTILTDDTATTPGGTTAQWGNTFYAPYVDMGGWPVPDLLAISRANGGGSLFTAAFMQATPDGKLAWAGLNALEPGAANDQAQSINRSIKALQAAGGDVMVSLGGQAGTSLAQWGSTHGMTAAQLAAAYAGVIDTYGITHLDFDIEGAAVAEPASIALNSQALRLLQQSKPQVQIWYTLPVLPTGLTADGLKVVDSALKAGVKLAGVNVMAMDYGESAAPTSGAAAKTMGAYAIDSAESTYAQLTKLYSGYGQSFSYSQLGLTPMLGVNDVTSEVFTLADAQKVEDYARTKGVGMVGLWSVTRDTPGALGVSTYTHSGMSVPAGSFAKIFNDYGTVNALNFATTGVGGTTVTAPTVSVANTTVTEGNSGTTNAAFAVTLSKAATTTVTVGYATANGTATAGTDYTAKTGTLTFAPGVTTQTVTVAVTGDATVEPTEAFTVTLTKPVGATLGTATATGTITNDDTAVTAPAPVAAQTKVVAAYYPEWGIYGRNFQVADIPAGELTHVIYSFLNLTSSGEVALYDSFAAVEKRFSAAESVSGEADQWYYPSNDPRSQQTVWGNFNQLAQLKQKYPNLRVNIALGGWTLSSNFSSVAATAAGREKLANSIVGFLDTYRMFDGIDFDWEYPGGGGLAGNSASPDDGANYAALLQLVRTKMDVLGAKQGRRYEISVASPAGYDKIANFNLAGLAPSVDYFNLMAYDFHGTWDKTTGHQSAFTGDPNGYDVKTAVELYLASGVSPGKIVLGAPLYTRAWSGVAAGGDGGYLETAGGAAPGTFEAGSYDYKDLLAQLKDPTSGWKLYWDDNAQAAYLYNASKGLFSSFETPTSIAQKSQWAEALGLRGMMLWDISNDAVGSPESLVKAAYSSWVLGNTLAAIRANSSLTGEVIIGGDGAITALPVTTAKTPA